jgi:glycosyltransferase involved in cell wall biosynthesis
MAPYLDQVLLDDAPAQTHSKKRPRNGSLKGRKARHGPPIVIFDDHNCEYMLQKSYARVDARIPRHWPGALYSLIQWQKLWRYEAQVCRRAHHVLAVSRTDAQALEQLAPNLTVTVIPNGIDTSLYEPACHVVTRESDAGRSPSLVFTGKMDFRPNVDAACWFADAIWPRVRAEVPEARFYIVGQRPHPRLDRLRADTATTLTGWVEDVRPYIAGATVYVAPLRMGSGTRLKLLEAMALGSAIVSTRMAAEGLTDAESELVPREGRAADPASGFVANDRGLILVDDDDPAAFANAVIALLRDPARRSRLGIAAREFVERHYDWRVIVPRLEALYAQLD